MFLGLFILKMKGGGEVSVDDRKKIWKDHIEKLMNIENEWSISLMLVR